MYKTGTNLSTANLQALEQKIQTILSIIVKSDFLRVKQLQEIKQDWYYQCFDAVGWAAETASGL